MRVFIIIATCTHHRAVQYDTIQDATHSIKLVNEAPIRLLIAINWSLTLKLCCNHAIIIYGLIYIAATPLFMDRYQNLLLYFNW